MTITMHQALRAPAVAASLRDMSDLAASHLRNQTVRYEPRVRGPNEALPPQINLFAQPVYVPPKDAPARPGANQHRQFKSFGIDAT